MHPFSIHHQYSATMHETSLVRNSFRSLEQPFPADELALVEEQKTKIAALA